MLNWAKILNINENSLTEIQVNQNYINEKNQKGYSPETRERQEKEN